MMYQNKALFSTQYNIKPSIIMTFYDFEDIGSWVMAIVYVKKVYYSKLFNESNLYNVYLQLILNILLFSYSCRKKQILEPGLEHAT